MTTLSELEARVAVLEANAASGAIILPPRAWTQAEADEVRLQFPGGADETYVSAVSFRDVDNSLDWFASILTVYGQTERNLSLLPHNVLMSIPLYANVDPWPLAAPEPFPGYIGPTTDPQEILDRSLIGQSWAGDPPVTADGLAQRQAIYDNVVGNVAGANGADWYGATHDALSVLVKGSGFQPYAHDFQQGTPYPYPGVYSLDGVCALLTGSGGQPG